MQNKILKLKAPNLTLAFGLTVLLSLAMLAGGGVLKARAQAPADTLIESIAGNSLITFAKYGAGGEVVYMTRTSPSGDVALKVLKGGAVTTIATGNVDGPLLGLGIRSALARGERQPTIFNDAKTKFAYTKKSVSLELHLVDLATLADTLVSSNAGNFDINFGFFVNGGAADDSIYYLTQNNPTGDQELKVYKIATAVTTVIDTGNVNTSNVILLPTSRYSGVSHEVLDTNKAQGLYTKQTATSRDLWNYRFNTGLKTLIASFSADREINNGAYAIGNTKVAYLSRDSLIGTQELSITTIGGATTVIATGNLQWGAVPGGFPPPQTLTLSGESLDGDSLDSDRDQILYTTIDSPSSATLRLRNAITNGDVAVATVAGAGGVSIAGDFANGDSDIVVFKSIGPTESFDAYDIATAVTTAVFSGDQGMPSIFDSQKKKFTIVETLGDGTNKLSSYDIVTGSLTLIKDGTGVGFFSNFAAALPPSYVNADSKVAYSFHDNAGPVTLEVFDLGTLTTTTITTGDANLGPILQPVEYDTDFKQLLYFKRSVAFGGEVLEFSTYKIPTNTNSVIESFAPGSAMQLIGFFYANQNGNVIYNLFNGNTFIESLIRYNISSLAKDTIKTADENLGETIEIAVDSPSGLISADIREPNRTDFTYNKYGSVELHTVNLAAAVVCTDPDADGVNNEGGACGPVDNCTLVANTSQTNTDGDALGDACDYDDDNDLLDDDIDTLPLTASQCVNDGPLGLPAGYASCPGQTSLTTNSKSYGESQTQSAIRNQDAINFLMGTAVDSTGNVYVTDGGNNRVEKFTSALAYTTQWGTSGTGSGQFSRPSGIAFNPGDGRINVVDTNNNRVQRFTLTGGTGGISPQSFGTLGTGNGQFDKPQGIATDASGNIYVTDTNNNRVQKFTNAGAFITKWGSAGNGDGQFNKPIGIAVSGTNVYVADTGNHRVQKFDTAGTFIAKWGTLGNADGQFNNPFGVTADASGNVYVADTRNDRIQKFDGNGSFLAKFGLFGNADGQYANQTGLSVNNSTGHLFIGDADNSRVQKVTTAGVFTAKVGTIGTGNGQFTAAQGITMYGNGVAQEKICSTLLTITPPIAGTTITCTSAAVYTHPDNIDNTEVRESSAPALHFAVRPAETITSKNHGVLGNELITASYHTQDTDVEVMSPKLYSIRLTPGSDVLVTQNNDGSSRVLVKEGNVIVLESDNTTTNLSAKTYAEVDANGIVTNTRTAVTDKNIVELHIINIGSGSAAKGPLPGADVRVFDRNNTEFQSIAGSKNPDGSLYGIIYEADKGRVSNCTTGLDGACDALEAAMGDYLVIVKYVDNELTKTVYTGKPKGPSDFVDTNNDGIKDQATLEFQIMKVFKNGEFQGYRGGNKTVILGSILEIISPDSGIWESASTLYPFIFTSDSDWTVNVCTEVPAGYIIVGVYDEYGNLIPSANCYQTLVANQTKVIAFAVLDLQSPEPSLKVKLTTHHHGQTTERNFKVSDIRRPAFEKALKKAKENNKPLAEHGVLPTAFAGTTILGGLLASLWNRRRIK